MQAKLETSTFPAATLSWPKRGNPGKSCAGTRFNFPSSEFLGIFFENIKARFDIQQDLELLLKALVI